ncbi:SRPBCC family protein [Allomuricauda sp. SCSIO 65647]|uniref:SRPBCC family protein n=1 Tax=Allomuricauda sp. SCSIO 65647 TaxID=2908843 RepID=UPI001F3D5F13|nr:SRPBCC family protein [Muricauda sp. SCSIO 65647]UJH67353.1 hypothetical protein L0P89_15560 [Muricauda sp. SCSIO 65647]
MTGLTSKWTMAALAVIGILLFLYLIGQKSVHTELVIEASPQQIWDVLMDEEGYKEWNHVLFPVAGEIEQGNSLPYHLINPKGETIEFEFEVIQSVPLELLNQKGGVLGVFTFDHRYILEPFGNHTKVTLHEDFRGIIVPFWNVDWVQQAYIDLNQSLRKFVLKSK